MRVDRYLFVLTCAYARSSDRCAHWQLRQELLDIRPVGVGAGRRGAVDAVLARHGGSCADGPATSCGGGCRQSRRLPGHCADRRSDHSGVRRAVAREPDDRRSYEEGAGRLPYARRDRSSPAAADEARSGGAGGSQAVVQRVPPQRAGGELAADRRESAGAVRRKEDCRS